jgi:hypothetical protein
VAFTELYRLQPLETSNPPLNLTSTSTSTLNGIDIQDFIENANNAIINYSPHRRKCHTLTSLTNPHIPGLARLKHKSQNTTQNNSKSRSNNHTNPTRPTNKNRQSSRLNNSPISRLRRRNLGRSRTTPNQCRRRNTHNTSRRGRNRDMNKWWIGREKTFCVGGGGVSADGICFYSYGGDTC